MKMILLGVALATLVASPLFAQSRVAGGMPRSAAYPKQKHQPRFDNGSRDGTIRGPGYPVSNPDPAGRGLCRTAPGFCPDYHGSNGG